MGARGSGPAGGSGRDSSSGAAGSSGRDSSSAVVGSWGAAGLSGAASSSDATGSSGSSVALRRARALFEPDPEWAYLDTATFGLPPLPAIRRLAEAERGWQRGDIDWYGIELEAESARDAFASFIGASAEEIALIPSISIGVGLIAASLPAGAEVLLPDDEYGSVILPMLVAAAGRGVRVREVPFDALIDEVGPDTALVGVSVPQMHTGRAPDLASLVARCQEVGAQLLLDASQGVPFVDLAGVIGRVDYLVAAGYKHLLCPHGASFMYVRRDRWDGIAPYDANWRASDEAAGARYLGGPLRLRPTAARFDTSLARLAWIGATESLSLLRQWRGEGLFGEVRALAGRLAAGLGLPTPSSSLVCLPVADPEAAAAALNHARVRGAIRVGHVRLAPHVWTTDDDVERAVSALRPFV